MIFFFYFLFFFFFNDTATTEIYTLSLHDALPIWCGTVAADEAAGGVDQRGDHPAMGHAAAVQMLGQKIEDDLGIVRLPDRKAVTHMFGKAVFGFGGVFHGRGDCRMEAGLSIEGLP